MRSRLLGLVGLLLLLACAGPPTAPGGPVDLSTAPSSPRSRALSPPNIVLIVLDDVDTYDLGVYGSSTVRTPRLDQLASQGVRFTQFYSCGANCSPTRASLLTGRPPAAYGWRDVIRFNHLSNGQPSRNQRGLPTSIPTVADILRQQGYVTGHLGKWHVGEQRQEHRPLQQGFDEERTWAATAATTPGDGFYWGYRLRSGATTELVPHLGEPGADQHYLTRRLTDEAIDFITRHQGDRFFLNLCHFSAHVPVHVPANFDNAAYGYDLSTKEGMMRAMLTDVDREVGRLIDHIDQSGLAQDTLVVVVSDNGGVPLSRVGLSPRKENLRNFKDSVYEGAIRVPLIARWPGTIPTAVLDAQTVCGTDDLLPTFAELAGAPTLPDGISGRSLVDALTFRAKPSDSPDRFWLLRRFLTYQSALDSAAPYEEWDQFAVRSGQHKLVFSSRSRHPELYDLSSGPRGEFADLSTRNPARVAELLARYKAWRKSVGNIAYTPELAGSVLTVPYDPRLEVLDGDFTFCMDFQVDSPGQEGVLAVREGCWEVLWSDGRVVLKLYDDRPDRTPEEREVRLVSQPLTLGTPHRIAFTLYGFFDTNRVVSLYVDGSLDQRLLPDGYPPGKMLWALPLSTGPICLGSRPDGSAAFTGTFSLPSMSTLALLPDEL